MSLRQTAALAGIPYSMMRKIAFIQTWGWLAPEYNFDELLADSLNKGFTHKYKHWSVNKTITLLKERIDMDTEELITKYKLPPESIDKLRKIRNAEQQRNAEIFKLISKSLGKQ